MVPHRLRAPAQDGAILSDPSLAEAPAALDRNRKRLDRWEYDFQGRPAHRIRAMARFQAYEAAQAFHQRHGIDSRALPELNLPLIVTGHQPELFHPGVWIKNFAVARIAQSVSGVGLNLIVDNDIPKSSTLRVPSGNASALRIKHVEFDPWPGEIPFEDWSVVEDKLFAQFGDEVHKTLDPSIQDPLIDEFWPRVLEAAETTQQIGLRFALARRATEAKWGIHNWEVPLSAICETDAFLWFMSHLFAQLPRFQAVHNASLARYRAMYHIRSKNHPVPALARQGDWLESPFWAWREAAPRRQPLMARQAGPVLQLRIAGENDLLIELPLSPDREACCAVEELKTLPGKGIRLRSRALTTTMFARLMLGDLFVHGIGGAKYDELGDEVVRGFFGIEPPTFLTMSMTLWLGLETSEATLDEYHTLGRRLRDLIYNPDRVLSDIPEHLILKKKEAMGLPIESDSDRLFRFRAIRKANEAFLPLTVGLRAELETQREQVLLSLKRDAQARSRDYASVLHSSTRLRQAVQLMVGLG